MSRFWGIVEKVTGISKEDLRAFVRQRAVEFAQSVTCVCGDPEWQHERQPDGSLGKCLRCNCAKFEPRFKDKSP